MLCSRTREGSSSAASGGSSRSIVNTPSAMSEEGGGATSSSDSSNGSSRFEIVGEEDIVGVENARLATADGNENANGEGVGDTAEKGTSSHALSSKAQRHKAAKAFHAYGPKLTLSRVCNRTFRFSVPSPPPEATAAQPFSMKPSASSAHRHHHPPVIGHDVAYIKMEQKLKDAMNRIAELMNEKESLEHLNIQLQEETETVGESPL